MDWRAPLILFRNMFGTLLTAFGTASSLATLPYTIQEVKYRQQVDDKIVQSVLPIGANLNMDGVAIYVTIATMSIAQAAGQEVTAGMQAGILACAIIASVAAPGMPTANIFLLKIVCKFLDVSTMQISWRSLIRQKSTHTYVW